MRGFEKLCQLMAAPGVLVTVSVLPLAWKLALPRTTCWPCGLAQASVAGSMKLATPPAKAE